MLTNQSAQQDTLLKFRLFDVNNDTFKHVSYFVRVTEPYKNEAPIIADLFHSHNGNLVLRMEPTDNLHNATSIEGQQESVLNGWLADENNTVKIKTPFFQHATVYRFEVEIFSIDEDNHVLTREEAPRFEYWIARGESLTRAITYDNQSYITTITSYFDTAGNFAFDSGKQAFTWSVPFDWNASRIEKIQNRGQLFVHQDITVPRILIEPDEPIVATVNGFALSGASIAIEEYKYEDSTVFHFLINRNLILNISGTMPEPAPSEMIFTFSQNTNEIPEFGISSLILAVTMATVSAFLILARHKKILF